MSVVQETSPICNTVVNSIMKNHSKEWTFCIVSEGFIPNSLVCGIGYYIIQVERIIVTIRLKN